MSKLYNRVVDAYWLPDVDANGRSRKFANKIVGGQDTFSSVYAGRRVRSDDFRRFYGLMVSGSEDGVIRNPLRNIL